MFTNLKKYYYLHQEQNIHALKYTIAIALGFLTIFIFDNMLSVAWVMITIAVVMSAQPVIGQQVLKGVVRFLGTLLGAGLGLIALYFRQDAIILCLLIAFTAFFAARFAATQDAEIGNFSALVMVTFSLMALMPQSSTDFILMRILDICIGIGISLFVSWCIFPLNSRRALIFESMRTFSYLAQFIQKVYIEKLNRQKSLEITQIDAQIAKSMTKERAIIRSGRYEGLRSPRLQYEYNQIVRYSRALFHYMIFIDVALAEVAENNDADAVYLRDALMPMMAWLIRLFKRFEVEKKLTLVALDWEDYRTSLAMIKQRPIVQHDAIQEQLGAIQFSLRRIPYCLELLISNWNAIQL